MKLIGLMGGLSWESTLPYYRIMNEAVMARLGGLHSARILLYSVDFAPIEELQRTGQWHAAGVKLAEIGKTLEAAGAELIVLCSNTTHEAAPQIQAAVTIPMLHICDPVGDTILASGLKKVGLLGTRYTMELDFYRERFKPRGIELIVPDKADRDVVHEVIYDELCVGKVLPASREKYRLIMQRLVDRGAQAILLGCTELTLLVQEGDASVPLFDSTRIHALAAVEFAFT